MARVTATNDPMYGKVLTCERYPRSAAHRLVHPCRGDYNVGHVEAKLLFQARAESRQDLTFSTRVGFAASIN
jgi:hypothetical protein